MQPGPVGNQRNGHTDAQALYSNPASHIWDAVMVKLHEKVVSEAKENGTDLRKFDLAPGIREVRCCTVSGLPATAYCPSTAMYFFTAGEAPTHSCYIHTQPEVDTEDGADTADASDDNPDGGLDNNNGDDGVAPDDGDNDIDGND